MIDLHTHTNESDGSLTPHELVEAALRERLEALAISDHDTFRGYDQALPLARERRLDLVCAIELNTKLTVSSGATKSVHVLAYFLHDPPAAAFRQWLEEILSARRARNQQLVDRLRAFDIDIQLSEVEAIGRSLTGRPHFARLLVNKGYAADVPEAFRQYLGETAPAFVERDMPHFAFAVQQITQAGGLPVAAHPVRLGMREPEQEEAVIRQMREMGLRGLEVYHSDHSAWDVDRYLGLARKYDMAVSGGSDFHGAAKPRVALGTGQNGNVQVPRAVLDKLREVQ